MHWTRVANLPGGPGDAIRISRQDEGNKQEDLVVEEGDDLWVTGKRTRLHDMEAFDGWDRTTLDV